MIGLLGSAVAAFLSSLAIQLAPEGIHLPLQAIIVGAFLLVWEQIAFAQARPYLREVVAREAVDVLEVGN